MSIVIKAFSKGQFICVGLVLSSLSFSGAYEDYNRCVAKERRERMDRWFNPMSEKNATRAAKDACYELKLKANKEYNSKRKDRLATEKEAWIASGSKCTMSAVLNGFCSMEDQRNEQRKEDALQWNEQMQNINEQMLKQERQLWIDRGRPCDFSAYNSGFCTHREYKRHQSKLLDF